MVSFACGVQEFGLGDWQGQAHHVQRAPQKRAHVIADLPSSHPVPQQPQQLQEQPLAQEQAQPEASFNSWVQQRHGGPQHDEVSSRPTALSSTEPVPHAPGCHTAGGEQHRRHHTMQQ